MGAGAVSSVCISDCNIVLFASETRSHALDYAALVQREKSVYYVCLSTHEIASHMIRDDLTSGWLK